MGRLVASRSRDLGISAIKEMSIRSAKIPDAASLVVPGPCVVRAVSAP